MHADGWSGWAMAGLNALTRLAWTEIRDNWMWHAGWMLALFGYPLMTAFLYPGEEGVKEILKWLEGEEMFRVFLGSIGGANPDYTLWMSLLLGVMSTIYFLYGVMTGPRFILRPIDKEIGEILHVLPIKRVTFHLTRWMEAFILSIGTFFGTFLILITPWTGKTVPVEKAAMLATIGIFFLMAAMGCGMILGMISGKIGTGIQLGLLLSILLHVFQSLARWREELEFLNDYNILSWFDVNGLLLDGKIPLATLQKLLASFVFVFIVSLLLFEKRDLIKNAPLPLSEKLNINLTFSKQASLLRRREISVKRSIFTFWAHFLEKKFPFAAEFIYSERMVLMVAFWFLVMMWPLQFIFYPKKEQELAGTIIILGNQPIFRVFTYGHELSSQPYLWFLVTQSLGNHWMIFVPLIVYWIGKIVMRDTNDLTGEIMASLPTSQRQVVLERLLAAFLELIYLILQMIAWLFICENLLVGKSIDTFWEVIALVSVLPLYVFLLTASVTLALIFKKNGVKLARLFTFLLFFSFVVGKISANLDTWQVTLLFGLYDPVLIIQKKSLFVNNMGIFIHILLALISTIMVIQVATRYQWIYTNGHPVISLHETRSFPGSSAKKVK